MICAVDHLVPQRPWREVVQGLHIVVQIQPWKHVLAADHAGYTAPTRQHELDHTNHTDRTDQGSICPERSRSSSGPCTGDVAIRALFVTFPDFAFNVQYEYT